MTNEQKQNAINVREVVETPEELEKKALKTLVKRTLIRVAATTAVVGGTMWLLKRMEETEDE